MEFKPMSGRVLPRFSGLRTFFRLPNAPVTADFDVALAGVPFDGGVSFRPGARFAPAAVREASVLGRGFHLTRGKNVFDRLRVADVGDAPTVPIDPKQTYKKVEKFFESILKTNKKFVAVGGDHSLTLPLLRAVRKKVGKPLSLIHFDAHLDTYPAAWGCEYHHGAFMRHALEEKLIDGKTSLQIGIRGPLTGADDLDVVKKYKVRYVTVDEIRVKGLESFLATLPEFARPTYLSYDIDCLDPAFAPGTGTPVPGGLSTYEVQRIMRALKIQNLVAADVMEVSPPYDPAQITSLAAVDALFEILHLM